MNAEDVDLQHILDLIDEAVDLARNAKQTVCTNGKSRRIDRPDTRTLLEAAKLKAMLVGYLGNGPKSMTPEMALKELDALRARREDRERGRSTKSEPTKH